MKIPSSVKEAIEIQKKLAEQIIICPLPASFSFLGAADLGYLKRTNSYVAAVGVFSWPDLTLVDEAVHIGQCTFPYVPGLLSFREVPPILEAWKKLSVKPEVFLCDGQGIAHPRGIGFASHLGLLLNIPSVGCAKTRLCGEHEPLDMEKGAKTPLFLNGKEVGIVYRSRTGVKPIYISPGHKADIESSVWLVEKCVGKYRIPEPLRWAHKRAAEITSSRKSYPSHL